MIPMNAPVSSPSSMSPRISRSSVSDSNAKGRDQTMSLTLTAFDKKPYLQLIRARGNTIRGVVDELKPKLNLANALDAGWCGLLRAGAARMRPVRSRIRWELGECGRGATPLSPNTVWSRRH